MKVVKLCKRSLYQVYVCFVNVGRVILVVRLQFSDIFSRNKRRQKTQLFSRLNVILRSKVCRKLEVTIANKLDTPIKIRATKRAENDRSHGWFSAIITTCNHCKSSITLHHKIIHAVCVFDYYLLLHLLLLFWYFSSVCLFTLCLLLHLNGQLLMW